jgi:4,4'-diaponeurosporenoate glycosyltransferase
MPVLELVSVVLRLAAGCWLLWRIPLAHAGAVARPSSIVIPARNEARSLPALLESLPADHEVVVVDDHSDDDTATIAAAAGATVVGAAELPPGWTGKTWACWTGAASTGGDILVFLDADVVLEEDGLDRLLAAHDETGGLLSVQPFHVTGRPYERLSAFFNVVAMMGSDAFTPLGRRLAPAGAFGPVLVTERTVYASVGGHQAVAGAVLDDVALARAYRDHGHDVTCIGGKGTASLRMYPDGLGQLVEGWTKNFAAGAGAARPLTLVLVVAWLSVCIQGAWWLARLPFVGGPGEGPWFALLAYGAVVAQLAWMFTRVGRFGWSTPLLYPIPLAAFLLVFGRSIALTTVRRKVRWKGREVPTRLRRRP